MIENSFSDGNPLFALSVLLFLGFVLGHLAEKLKLPSLVGQILAGILVGPYGLLLSDLRNGCICPLKSS